MEDQDELKILGFVFGRKADVGKQITSISLKFRRRVWVLRHLKKAGVPHPDLIRLYMSLVQPVLDYTAVVYHSMLGKVQSQELEKLQKLALKIIYGVTGVTYTALLERSGLPTLAERRLGMVDKFILKAANHQTYKLWFPTRLMSGYGLREERVYEEKQAIGQRDYTTAPYFSIDED